jgi:hypothetical protein
MLRFPPSVTHLTAIRALSSRGQDTNSRPLLAGNGRRFSVILHTVGTRVRIPPAPLMVRQSMGYPPKIPPPRTPHLTISYVPGSSMAERLIQVTNLPSRADRLGLSNFNRVVAGSSPARGPDDLCSLFLPS